MPTGESIGFCLARRAAAHADRPFLLDARSDRSIGYGRAADLVGAYVATLDAEAAETVFVDIADPLTFAVAHLSIVVSGRRSVPVDPTMPAKDLGRLANLVGAATVVTGSARRAEAAGIARLAPPDLHDATDGRIGIPRRTGGAAMLFTSGSTGTPKGVELTEPQLLHVARAVADHLELGEHDRGYNSLPLFHINAEVVALLGTLVSGGSLVLDQRFHRTGFWPMVRDRSITWINAVPAILAVLATEPLDIPESVRFIRSASAPLPAPVAEAFSQVPLAVSYGMTEASSQITATPLHGAKPGTVGVPVGTEVVVRTPQGEPVPTDVTGELWIRGPGVVRHYYADAAADRFDPDGWLWTGDLGSIDADGHVTLAGRKDDVINRGGEKLYPLEIEEVLLRDPGVREAVVVGAPHPVLGSVPVAMVIPTNPDRTAEQDDQLRARLTDLTVRLLPKFKQPTQISVVSDVPRAATGKVRRVELREAG